MVGCESKTNIRLQNYTNMVVDELGIQTFKVLIFVLLSFDAFVPTSTHLLLIMDKWFVQFVYLNISVGS